MKYLEEIILVANSGEDCTGTEPLPRRKIQGLISENQGVV